MFRLRVADPRPGEVLRGVGQAPGAGETQGRGGRRARTGYVHKCRFSCIFPKDFLLSTLKMFENENACTVRGEDKFPSDTSTVVRGDIKIPSL